MTNKKDKPKKYWEKSRSEVIEKREQKRTLNSDMLNIYFPRNANGVSCTTAPKEKDLSDKELKAILRDPFTI